MQSDRLQAIARCMDELEAARAYYGRPDSIGEQWGRIVWECDWRGELKRLLYGDEMGIWLKLVLRGGDKRIGIVLWVARFLGVKCELWSGGGN